MVSESSGVIVFWLVWWAWTQFTWSLNEADTENPVIRLTTLVATVLAFIMAMSLPLVGTESGWLFPLAYLVVRIVGISLQWLLVEDDEGWSSAVRRWTVLSSLGLVAVAVAVVVAPGIPVPCPRDRGACSTYSPRYGLGEASGASTAATSPSGTVSSSSSLLVSR